MPQIGCRVRRGASRRCPTGQWTLCLGPWENYSWLAAMFPHSHPPYLHPTAPIPSYLPRLIALAPIHKLQLSSTSPSSGSRRERRGDRSGRAHDLATVPVGMFLVWGQPLNEQNIYLCGAFCEQKHKESRHFSQGEIRRIEKREQHRERIFQNKCIACIRKNKR